MGCFSKARRLIDKPLYDRVFQKAKKIYFPEFLLLYRENNLEFARLGLAVSKKSMSKAVSRNLCKRLVRESFRAAKLPHIDIVFISRKGIEQLSRNEIHSKLQQAWAKLNGKQIGA